LDYRLQTTSPAVDKAVASDSLLDMRHLWRTAQGSAPDIGALEVDQRTIPADEVQTLTTCPNGVGNVAELNDAIRTANARPGANRIELPANCLYTVVTAAEDLYGAPVGLPVISDPLEIVGNGSTIRRSTEITLPLNMVGAYYTSLWFDGLAIENGFANYGSAISASCGYLPIESIVLEGVTLRNNVAQYGGGAIYTYCVDLLINDGLFEKNVVVLDGGSGGALSATSAIVEVNNSTFNENISTNYGGAILIGSGELTVHNSTFANNDGRVGGAVALLNSEVPNLWVNNLWINNKATEFVYQPTKAAAIYLLDSQPLTLLHNTFANTLVTDAAAVVIDGATLGAMTTLRNSIIANLGGTIASRYPLTNPVEAEYNLFWNAAVIGEGLAGNPLFVDEVNGDYHLQANSPAVNSGMDAGIIIDREKNARPNGGGFDMGAYEYIAPDNPEAPDEPEVPGNPEDPEKPDDPINPSELESRMLLPLLKR
jgi:hypothetical protein